jgi:NADH:ubiquinone oxidoreductase subunit 3 (subunit A)
MIKISNRE